jgi:hypothetical protein
LFLFLFFVFILSFSSVKVRSCALAQQLLLLRKSWLTPAAALLRSSAAALAKAQAKEQGCFYSFFLYFC